MQLQTAYCHLKNRDEELRKLTTMIPSFTKLHWICYYRLAVLLMQKKCEMYWPENTDTSAEYGDISVSVVEVERFGDYVRRTMKIRHLVNIANE